jgi:serine/threonine protein kinase
MPESTLLEAIRSEAETVPLTRGDFCDLSLITYTQEAGKESRPTVWDRLLDEGEEVTAVLKMTRRAVDNDLLDNELRILNHLFPPDAKEEKFLRYLPHLLAAFTEGGHRVNALTYAEGYVSLEDILKSYPNGIDYRDFAWMFRRLLEGLFYVHRHGVVHGALVPSHVLIHPTEHGAKIIDWSYAVRENEVVKAIVAQYRAYYPMEILTKASPRPCSDLYMAAKCGVALMGGNPKTNEMPDKVPPEIQAFFQGCLQKTPSMRPSDASELYDEYSEVLRKLLGKPKYRPFKMPPLN